MDTEGYKKLLQKYLDGQCTEEEEALLQRWYDSLDILAMQQQTAPEGEALEDTGARIWQQVAQRSLDQPKKKSFTLFYKVAAAALVLLSLSWFYYEKTNIIPLTYRLVEGQPQEQQNTSSHIQALRLSDGTHVQLYPGASLSFPQNFKGDSREVFLKGKAFFQVAKNKEKPFIVHNYHNDVQVLGTSFMVMSAPNITENFIEVNTGRVWVRPKSAIFSTNKNTDEAIILTPNKRLAYNVKAGDFEAGLVEKPKPMSVDMESHAAQYSFTFTDAPLNQVINALEGMYGVHIVLKNPKLQRCTFTGDLNDEDLFKKLTLLCATMGAKFTIHETNIIIDGEGC